MKEMMDQATKAMAEGEYVEAEAFAKKAQEIDPNEVAAAIIAFKAKMERRYKTDLENRDLKEKAPSPPSKKSTAAAIADPEVQLRGIQYPKNFKDLTRERLRMNAKLRAQEDPEDARHRGQAQRAGLAEHGQAAPRRGDQLPRQLHRAEHRPRPEGASTSENITTRLARHPRGRATSGSRRR